MVEYRIQWGTVGRVQDTEGDSKENILVSIKVKFRISLQESLGNTFLPGFKTQKPERGCNPEMVSWVMKAHDSQRADYVSIYLMQTHEKHQVCIMNFHVYCEHTVNLAYLDTV